MIERKTVIDQIEIRRDGSVQVRFGLLLVENGVEIDCKWHRTAVPLGGDVAAQITAAEADLSKRGHPAVEKAEKDRLTDLVAAVSKRK